MLSLERHKTLLMVAGLEEVNMDVFDDNIWWLVDEGFVVDGADGFALSNDGLVYLVGAKEKDNIEDIIENEAFL